MNSIEAVTNTTIDKEAVCQMDCSIWSWANAYKVSFSIFALNELGILEALSHRFLSARRLAGEFEVNEELLAPLLELLASIGILQESAEGFSAPAGIETLLPLLSMESRLSASHVTTAQIAQVVRRGAAADIFQKGDVQEVQEYIPLFTAAMRSSARTLAPHLIRFANLRQSRHLLDLGGADGSLALAIQRMAPGLPITVLDLPRMEQAFHNQMAEHGSNGLITFHCADLRAPQSLAHILKGPDTIVISNVIHLLTTEQRTGLFRVIHDCSMPATRLLIYDQFVDDSQLLHATNFMTVDWVINGVRFHETAQDCTAGLQDIGFYDIDIRQFPGLPGAIIKATV